MKKKFIKLLTATAAMVAPISAIISCSGGVGKFDSSKKDSVIQIVGPNGHKDGAFQEVAWNGLEKGKNEFEKFKHLKEVKATKSDQKENQVAAKAAISSGSYVIFGNGEGFKFLASNSFAGAHKDREFLITDASLSADDEKNWANTTAVSFASNQGAFMSALGAAFYMTENAEKFGGAKDLKVGFWGGAQYDSVDSFIAGFIDGIKYFNSNYAKTTENKIEIVNSKFESKESSYSGSWGQDTNAQTMVDTLIDKGADVLFPVAGEQVKTAISKAKTKENIMIVGVDSDPKKAYGPDSKYFITASIKNVDEATYEYSKLIFGQESDVLELHKQNDLGIKGNFVGFSKSALVGTKLEIGKYKEDTITAVDTIYDFLNKNNEIKKSVADSNAHWNLDKDKGLITS